MFDFRNENVCFVDENGIFKRSYLTNCDKMLHFVTLKMVIPIYNGETISFMWEIMSTLLLTVVSDMSAYLETKIELSDYFKF